MIGSALTFYSWDEVTPWVINDRITYPNLHADDPFWFISVSSIDGASSSDISYESHPIPNATGEMSGDVFRRGKTTTLSGKITALNLPLLMVGREYLMEMFNDLRIRKLKYIRLTDLAEIYYRCRVSQDLIIVENVASGKYELDWVVALRCDNPLTYNFSDDSLDPEWQT
jgi:hypothetical protein